MNPRTVSQPAAWGSAAIATVTILAALCVGGATGTALFWATNIYDYGALTHTLTIGVLIAAIVADLSWMTRTGTVLYRSYRRPS